MLMKDKRDELMRHFGLAREVAKLRIQMEDL